MAFATHILVPTDFSGAAKLAVDAAALLAEELGARLTVVFVHDPDGLHSPAQIGFSPSRRRDLGAQVLEADTKALEELRGEIVARAGDANVELVHHRSAAQGICEHADKIGADLIVIATHGRTGLKHLLIGSVAERVVRFSKVPVLTLRSTNED